jgi:hypothetical protein
VSRGGDVERAITAAAEVGNLRELGERVLPLLARAMRASATLLYRYDDNARLVPFAGEISELIENYALNYLHRDPVQVFPRQLAQLGVAGAPVTAHLSVLRVPSGAPLVLAEVRTHVRRILAKLGVRSRVQAALIAARQS